MEVNRKELESIKKALEFYMDTNKRISEEEEWEMDDLWAKVNDTLDEMEFNDFLGKYK